jgi:hypothetical protein
MIIRFVQGTDVTSKLIVAQEKTAMPFTPSHAEALTPDGSAFIGAHIDGGVMKRPVGYDLSTTAIDPTTGKKRELLLRLEATAAQDAAFYAFLESHIGEPYDWRAILGFILPDHEHIPDHAICSALVTLALRAKGCEWFEWSLAAPAHLVDPRDLLLLISGRMAVPM